jgi:hypothetical protein
MNRKSIPNHRRPKPTKPSTKIIWTKKHSSKKKVAKGSTMLRHEKELSVSQNKAIAGIVSGLSDEASAKLAGVTRKTVSQWRNHDPIFITALNKASAKSAKELMEAYQKNTKSLVNAALVSVAMALKKEDAPTARWFLDKISFSEFAGKIFESMVDPDLPPDTLASVIEEMASKRVDKFLTEKNITGIERLKLQPILKAKEQAALLTEYSRGHDSPEG